MKQKKKFQTSLPNHELFVPGVFYWSFVMCPRGKKEREKVYHWEKNFIGFESVYKEEKNNENIAVPKLMDGKIEKIVCESAQVKLNFERFFGIIYRQK